MNRNLNSEERERERERELRVGADEGTEQKSGADPILGDLVVNLCGQVLPETRHYLLLERGERVDH